MFSLDGIYTLCFIYVMQQAFPLLQSGRCAWAKIGPVYGLAATSVIWNADLAHMNELVS